MTDLTKITTPFGLLDAETQQALRDHLAAGGELEVYNNGWRELVGADFYFGSPVTYRAKPKPKPLELWVNEYDWGFGEVHQTKPDANKWPQPNRIRCIRLIEAPDQSEGV
jgi:hypothetical protein